MAGCGAHHRSDAQQCGRDLWTAQFVADADQIGHAMVFEEHAQFVAGITPDQIAPREHARHVADRIVFAEFKQTNAAQSRFRPIAFESAGRRVAKIDVVHMPDERVLMVMPAEQREIAARIAQRLHFANVFIRASDCLSKP